MNIKNQKGGITLKFDFRVIKSFEFRNGVDAFIGLIEDVSKAISEKEKIEWEIEIKPGSAIITAKPAGDFEISPQGIIMEGINLLEKNPIRPNHFSDSALRRVKSLASLGNQTNKIKIGIYGEFFNISSKSIVHINELLGEKKKALGSIDGILNLISDRRGLHFEIRDRVTRENVKCYFKVEDVEKVVLAFRKRVKVNGLLRYRIDGSIISIEVEDFEIIEDKDLPTFYNMIGILSD